LRWNFVYQRPQHLLNRCARDRRVIFIEEARYLAPGSAAHLEVTLHQADGSQPIWVVVPHLPDELSEDAHDALLAQLVDQAFGQLGVHRYALWYYTPFALNYTRHLKPVVTIYDCMDELSAFKGAPPELRDLERELFQRADVVFTGGQSLYEAKRQQHRNVHAFPSSIDVAHFAQARVPQADPTDQAAIPHPRLGFFGVLDERFDRELIDRAAQLRPDWHFVFIGPVVKIDPADLPHRSNIHYLGQKSYQDLPRYLANWDVALLPFALNESTRFISPTKTPEYLAGGKPVVSTPIRDVIRPYGDKHLVRIARTPDEFVHAIEQSLEQSVNAAWLAQVDAFLADMSWDKTWHAMWQLIHTQIKFKGGPPGPAAQRRYLNPGASLPFNSSAAD
jgi:UDP-galactopyranose mutase